MNPRIIERDAIVLLGMDFCGDPYGEAPGWSCDNAIGKLWARFSSFFEKNRNAIKHLVSDAGYEVWVEAEGLTAKDEKYIFVGVEVERIEDVPLALVVRVLPKTTYGVFTLKGKDIVSDWSSRIYGEWLPQSEYEAAHPFLIEYYDPARFRGLGDEESELDVCVPLVGRAVSAVAPSR